MGAEVVGGELLREVKEEGLDEVCSLLLNSLIFKISASFYFLFLFSISIFIFRSSFLFW